MLVSTDIIGFYKGTAEYLRQAILDGCKLQPAELMLCAIHTHSAPSPALDDGKSHPNNIAYTKTLAVTLTKLVHEALAHLRPASVGVGTGASPVGINRRQPFTDKAGRPQIRLGRNPSGPTDPEVQVLQIRELPGERTAAVMFAYATHSTSLGAKNLVVSGDVHGLAAQFVEKHLGDGLIAPEFAGASGDIDPWFRVLPEFKTGNGWIPEPVLLGTMLGEEVVQTSNGIRQFTQNGPIASILQEINLPAKPDQEKATGNPPALPFTISLARVGDVAFVGLGGEVFHAIGRAIKKASPFPHTFIFTHCNGAAGYLVVKEAYPEGGYEVNTTHFTDAAADMVVKEAGRLLNQMKQ